MKFLLMILLMVWLVGAATHYSAPTGTATWENSTNIATPCSLSVVFGNAAAGDTVFFRNGSYYGGSRGLTNSGTSGNRIILKNFPDETPIFHGDNAVKVLKIGYGNSGGSYTTFHGISFTNSYGSNVDVGENYTITGLTFDSCSFSEYNLPTDNVAGIYLWQTVLNTTIRNCLITGPTAYTFWTTGILSFVNNGSITVENNEISSNTSAFLYKHRGDGSVRTIIRNNFLHDNAIGVFISNDNCLISNNLIVNNGIGVKIWLDAGGTGGGYSRIEHNTMVDTNTSVYIDYGGQLSVTGDAGAKNDTVVNNICYVMTGGDQPVIIWPFAAEENKPTGHVTDYNNYYISIGDIFRELDAGYTLSEWVTGYPLMDANSVVEAPQFASETPTVISDYEIVGGAAKGGASDLLNMGCNVETVGISGLGNTKAIFTTEVILE